MIFVGADVHVRNSYLYATDFEGKRLVHGRVPNTLAELRSFCDELMSEVGGEVQPVRFVLESTTNSRPVQSRRAGTAAGPGAPGSGSTTSRPMCSTPASCGSSPRAWPSAMRSTAAC